MFTFVICALLGLLGVSITLGVLYPLELGDKASRDSRLATLTSLVSGLEQNLANVKRDHRIIRDKYIKAKDSLDNAASGAPCSETHLMDVIDSFVPLDVYQDLVKEIDTSNSWSDDFDTFLVARLTKPNDNDLKHMLLKCDESNFDRFAQTLATNTPRFILMQRALSHYGTH